MKGIKFFESCMHTFERKAAHHYCDGIGRNVVVPSQDPHLGSQSDVRKSSLPASSLVEVLVALSLSSIIFVIGAMVWLQLNGMAAPFRQIDQRMTARQLIDAATLTKTTQDEIIKIGGINFERKINPINSETGLYEIIVIVYNQENQPFFQRGKIVKYDAP
mgnify:CR=1 FL=1